MPHTTSLAALAGKRVAVLGSLAARAIWLSSHAEQAQTFTLLDTVDPREALEEADFIVVLDWTSVEQIGTPHEVYHHPASERVLKLFGPANTLRGRLEFRTYADGGRPVFCSTNGEPARLLPGWLSPVFENESGIVLIVRPHDVEVLAEQPHGTGGGPLVKVTLTSAGGESWTAELSHAQYQRQPFSLHQPVFLRPRAAYVFPVNYDI